jgi:flagellar assembly protein FliH
MSIIPKEQLGGFQRWQINSFDQSPVITAPVEVAPAVVEKTVSTSEEPAPNLQLPSAEDIERIHEEARKAGYEAGLAEGLSEAEKQSEQASQELTKTISGLLQSFESALVELDQSVANQLLDLALEVSRQLTGGAIKARADILLPIIKEAIAYLPMHHAQVTVHLNPEDAAIVRAGLAATDKELLIHESADITRGGCRLTAGTSEVDASIETRWSRVLEAIGSEPQAWLSPK